MVQLTDSERAMLRSQSGPLAGVPLSTTPANFLSRIDSHLFRVLLLRRLRLPLPLSARQCRCGRPLDAFGHDRAACARAGVLGRRGFAVESAGARICREAGGQSCGERNAPRLRFSRSKPSGPASLGDPRRWLAPLWGGAACSGHNSGVAAALRRLTTCQSGKCGWSCLGGGHSFEGENVPRTHGASQPSPSGRSGRRDWRALVRRDQKVFCLF